MNELIDKIIANPLAVSLISLLAGALITTFVSKILNKTGVFHYTVLQNRVGLSADDTIFGSVRISWQGHDVRNLYTVTIEIENSTSKDYEPVKFNIYTDNETILLNEKTEIVNTPHIVQWSENFKNEMHVNEGEQASEAQLQKYNHNREYEASVYNRGQILKFTYLCTRPNDDLEPSVWPSTMTKGVKLKYQVAPFLTIRPIFGVPVHTAIKRGLLLSLIAVLLCGFYLENPWLISVISMVIGLCAQIVGAIQFKIEKYIKQLVTG